MYSTRIHADNYHFLLQNEDLQLTVRKWNYYSAIICITVTPRALDWGLIVQHQAQIHSETVLTIYIDKSKGWEEKQRHREVIWLAQWHTAG